MKRKSHTDQQLWVATSAPAFDGSNGSTGYHPAHKLSVLGDDGILRCEMPVDGFAWIASRWTEVPTLTGLQQMRLQHGRHAYRLRGQGFPVERRGEPGDYIVTVVPTFPQSLSAEQEALLDRLMAAGGESEPVRAWERKVRAWELRRGGAKGSDPAAKT